MRTFCSAHMQSNSVTQVLPLRMHPITYLIHWRETAPLSIILSRERNYGNAFVLILQSLLLRVSTV